MYKYTILSAHQW